MQYIDIESQSFLKEDSLLKTVSLTITQWKTHYYGHFTHCNLTGM